MGYFFGIAGTTKKISNLSETNINQILECYNINSDMKLEIENFEFRSYGGNYMYIIKIKKEPNLIEELTKQNSHIEKITNLYRIGIYLYPNQRFIPITTTTDKLHLFYTSKYIYISAIGVEKEFNSKISNLFWELYNE